MANTTSALWDMSGQDKNTLASGTRKTSESSTDRARSSGTSTTSGSSSSFSQNMSNSSLATLEALIAQLSNRPKMTEQEAMRLAPDPVYQNFGHVDPRYGFTITADGVANYNQALQAARAKRLKLIQESGIQEGGTPELLRQRDNQRTEIDRIRNAQSGYTKEAALEDANKLTGKFTRQLMEQVMPEIRSAVEASGTSGGAVQGLLAQDAAARVAENQAALGLSTATEYGKIFSDLEGILAPMVNAGDPVMTALLQALQISKGSIESKSSTQTQTTTEDKTIDTDKTSNQDLTQMGTNTGNRKQSQTILPATVQGTKTGSSNISIQSGNKPKLNPNQVLSMLGGGENYTRLEAFNFG